jgi:hypothetical protein
MYIIKIIYADAHIIKKSIKNFINLICFLFHSCYIIPFYNQFNIFQSISTICMKGSHLNKILQIRVLE